MNRFGDPEVGWESRHRWRRPMGGVHKVFGSFPSSSSEEGGGCFWMNGGNSWGCNAWLSSSNASTLMAFQGFSDDVSNSVAAEVGIPTSLSRDNSVLEEEIPKLVLGGESDNLTDIRVEVECIDHDSCCNGDEVAHRVPSRSLMKGSSGNLDGDFTGEAGGSCCSLISSKCMDASMESFSVAESEKVNNGSLTCLHHRRKEDNQLSIIQNVKEPGLALASMKSCSNGFAAGCSNDDGPCVEVGMRKTTTAKCVPINLFRRTNPKRGASLRSNLADEKFNLMVRFRSDGRKCRRKLSSGASSAKMIAKIFSEVKRKKRGSDRQGRLSPWGAIENLFHIIKHDEFINNESQVNQSIRKSKKVGSEAGSRKGVHALKKVLPYLSASKSAPAQRTMVDTQASLKKGVNNLMLNLEQNLPVNKISASVRPTQRVFQQGNKDPESSLMQETSADNLPGVCYGILSQANLKSLQDTVDKKQPLDAGLPNFACFDRSLVVQKCLETRKMHLQDVSKGQQSETIISSRSARVELSKGRSSLKHKKKIQQTDIDNKEDILFKEDGHVGFTPKFASKFSFYGGKTDGSNACCDGEPINVASSVINGVSARELYHVLLDQSLLSGQKAWALCDDCQQWRCIPKELVHVIENGKWTCKDNVDDSFADCMIPQEKTNEVINKELEISDEENCSTSQPGFWVTAPQRRTSTRRVAWTLIKSNLFLNRNRKTQTIDEIMVCYCKPPKDGSLGCRDACLNHMLNIECVKGTCPCGDLCSNQQFRKGKYAKFKWIKCGKKGYGLQLEEDVSCGQFLIEYVGEVLDLAAYEARLRYYVSRGHKHFYFMTLNGGEVIDACGKGNLGRFINHSCDPNCRTEKWMVNGEVCIGLFAIRDIKKGEEVTFDYNYVRVFGAAAKKCVCGSAECQGYIGGDPLNSEVIVHDDLAEEDPEPVMIDEDGEIVQAAVEGTTFDAADEAEVIKHDNVSIGKVCGEGNPDFVENDTFVENEDAMEQSSSEPSQIDPFLLALDCRPSSKIQSVQDLKLVIGYREPNQTFCGPVNDDQQLHTDHVVHGSGLNLSPQAIQTSDSVHKNNLITYPVEENSSASKPCNLVEPTRPIRVKWRKAKIKSSASQRGKKVQTNINNRHIEGVEEKLNQLLDGNGGISRQKDSAKWYLKLLVVTAAAGDDINCGLSQSARDLSLILDAILKTKSRTVLVDIISKNGLQMLHNLMKQNRDNFSRIPILRKLLKALEFLAEKQILTLEHINRAPPCRGMESFKESMLKLMKHRDSQVHTIARNFADHWIPRNFRRVEPSDRDSRQSNTRYFPHSLVQTSNFNLGHEQPISPSPSIANINGEASHQQVPISASLAESNHITRPRKRKSRWDQPSSNLTKPASSTEASTAPDLTRPISYDDDHFQFPLNVAREVVMGPKQEHYLPHLPVSFGMPIRMPEIEGKNRCDQSRQIAPAMPFKPFPPLPSYPRREPECLNTIVAPPHANKLSKQSFFKPVQSNNQKRRNNHSKLPQGGTGCRFEGGYRSKGPALHSGNLMMNVGGGGGGCSLPDFVSTKYNLNFLQEHHS